MITNTWQCAKCKRDYEKRFFESTLWVCPECNVGCYIIRNTIHCDGPRCSTSITTWDWKTTFRPEQWIEFSLRNAEGMVGNFPEGDKYNLTFHSKQCRDEWLMAKIVAQ